MKAVWLLIKCGLASSKTKSDFPVFETINTDFSKGRLSHQQTITIDDLEKFHDHLCDGLVVGALGINQAIQKLFPDQPIDRTNLRIVSKPSPCLTDVAIYLTGGRYQFNTFYVDDSFSEIYIVQRMDNQKTISVSLNKGVKPTANNSLGNIAIKQELPPCEIDYLNTLEEDFTEMPMGSEPDKIFTVSEISNFEWKPNPKNDYLKLDIINKKLPNCN